MNEETKVNQIIEMLEIYRNTDLNELNAEDAKLVIDDLQDKKQQLDEQLERLYADNQIADSGKISMMEATISDIDSLLEEISDYAKTAPLSEIGNEEEEPEVEEDEEEPEIEEDEEVSEVEEDEEEPEIEEDEEEPEVEKDEEKLEIELEDRPTEEYKKEGMAVVFGREKKVTTLEKAITQGESLTRKLMEQLHPTKQNRQKEMKQMQIKDYEKDERIR